MPDIAELRLSIDTRQLEQGAQAMDRLGAASEGVEKKVDSATTAIDKLGKASTDAKGKTAEGAAAVDAIGEAGARLVPKVDAATTSIDAMGATATRIRTVFLGGSNTLDGFMGSSMGVWRSSEAAAAGIDSLGASTERTWKKQADYNGAMADTSRLMRQAAEAARTLEESNHKMLVQLQREIDTFGMARGELERYRAAELGLGSAAQTKAAALGNSIDAMHREERAARDAAGAQDRAAAAGDRFIKSLQDQVATLGMTTQQLQTYRAAQLGVSDAAAPLINKLAETGEGAKKAGGHMEGFSFQSASAKRELLVLAHELSQGQFQRFGGSMMVLGEQTGAAGLLFSSTGLAVLGFAAALGTVAYAMIKGASEQREMNNALISTNNYAGVTSDKLNELAHAATAAHGSIGEAKKVVTELTGTGKFTGDQIAYITDAVIALEYATGTSVKKTIKEFESLAVQSTGSTNRATEVITRATVKLDDTYHFLTLSVYEQIRALEKDGDAKAASAVATAEFARATKDGADQMIENLGSVAKAWHGITAAIGKAMDAIGEYGKKDTPGRDVKAYSGWLADLDTKMAIENKQYGRAADFPIPAFQEKRAEVVLKLVDAVDRLNQADAAAIAQGKTVENNSRAVHAAAMIHAEDIRMQKKGMSELAVALDAYKQNREAIRAVDPDSPLLTPEAVAAGIAARTKAHTEQTKPKADQVENTELADQIKQYAKEAATAKAHYDALGKLDDMYLKGGELSVQQAYQNKRDYALKTYEAEIDAFDQEIGALQGHNSATKAEAAKHQKELNEILGKRDAAEKAFFDASFMRDEEERLRQAATATAATDAANKEIASINDQVAAVEMQIRTYGMLPAAKTAVMIADIAEKNAALAGIAGAEKTIELNNLKIDGLKRLRAVQGISQAQEAGTDVAKAKELLDILTAVDTAAQAAATGMAESFGAVGKAIGSLTTALTGYERTQAAVAAQLKSSIQDAHGDRDKVAKAQGMAAQQGAQAQIKSYGDMASAAKGFFKENSAGYRALEGAEKAYRAFEMAMAIQSMVTKSGLLTAFTGLFVTAKATETAATVASVAPDLAASAAKGAAAAAVGVATQAQGDPYSAWARMAAMAAVMAALGFAVAGGGGGADTTAKDRQAATGTGSVLGNSSAKSESIAHSLAIMEKNSGLGLAQGAQMVGSLHQIVQGIGGLGSLLVRNAGVTGATAPDSLGAAQKFADSVLGKIPLIGGLLGKTVGGLIGSIFGGKTTTLDTGVTFGKTSLASIQAGGVSASQYTDTKTSGGWFSSDKYHRALSGLGAEANGQFAKIIMGLSDTVRSAASALGLGGDAFSAKLNSFVVGLDVSLKGLSGDDLQKALEAAFSKLGDDMASFGVAGLEQYQAVGEGYLETLARVSNDYMQVSDVLSVLNKSFGVTGLAAVSLSEGLINAAGGLDKLTSGTSYFVENFLTEAERMAPITKSANDAMGKLGASGVTTVDQFKALVLAQDLSTTAGQSMYAQLIAIAEPFKKAADYAAELAAATGEFAVAAKTASEIASEHRDLQQQLNQLTKSENELLAIQRAGLASVNRALFDQVQAAKAVVTAKDALAKAYETESTAAKTALDKSKSWVVTLNGLNASMALGAQSTLTPEQKYAEARAQFEKTLAAANAGDSTAQSGLSAAEQAFLSASQVVNASDARYVADYARVMAANDEAMRWASTQVDVAQASLDALTAQVLGLITINDSVLTVAQAIANLQVAMGVSNGLGVEFTNAPAVAVQAAMTSAPVPVVFDATRYSAGSNVGSDALVAEIRALNSRLDAQTVEIKGLREDQKKQTGATIQATVESNASAAKTVVAGVEKSAKTSAWGKPVEYQK
ncbi:phage tail length tape measure family protein [Janthinobacterium sp. PC23-8]|uniref:phage tail length tape measure family protein n=1 Tax=Janthinobacterium sp. PC23-8 TaxID=2012679 RepID=UPI000B978DD7|nr:phage tail length tape measure family protein [Janthinobacterium sp. PC23-8]OYO29144.1 hypothetical protein CD932_18750 [Janthinobacterium sp. PC23-8]